MKEKVFRGAVRGMKKNLTRNSWISFISAIVCVIVGAVIGLGLFMTAAGSSNGGGSGLSGILLIAIMFGGGAVGGALGAVFNLIGIVQASLSLRRMGASAGAILALVVNALMCLGFGSICAMACFAQYV